MRRAKPVLATAAIALSLTACGWMGGGGEQSANRPSGSAGLSKSEAGSTTTAQQYPSASPQFVQRVQQRLGERGYDVGPVDGQWGQSTQSALRNFQRDQGLSTSGQIDTQTLAALGIQSGDQQQQGAQAGGTSQQATPQRQQQPYQPTTRRSQQQSFREDMSRQQTSSMSPDVVRDVQQGLEDRGYDVGQVDGIWGPNTRQALTAFQRDQNLRADGRIDDQTIAALGVDRGSQVGQTPDEPPPARPPAVSPDSPPFGEPEPDIGPR